MKDRLLAEARGVKEDRSAVRQARRFEWTALLIMLGTVAFRSPRWRYWRSAAVRLLVLAALPVLYLTGLLLVHVLVKLIGSGSVRIAWTPLLAELGAVALLAVLIGFTSGFFALARYAQGYTSEHVRRRLDLQPRLIRLLWTALAVTAVATALVHDGVWSALDILGWVVAPIVTYLALRWSRTRPNIRWSKWAAAPLWGMVEQALHAERTRQEANRDRFFQEAQEAAA